MAFTTVIKIRFGDEDHAGIVYYPRFFDFFHQAFEDFFEAEGHPYRKVLDEDGCGWPAVHVEADFRSPLRFGDRLELTVEVERVGGKSATFRYRGVIEGTDRHVVDGQVVCACIDMKTFEARTIPDVYRAVFERHLVDHGVVDR